MILHWFRFNFITFTGNFIIFNLLQNCGCRSQLLLPVSNSDNQPLPGLGPLALGPRLHARAFRKLVIILSIPCSLSL